MRPSPNSPGCSTLGQPGTSFWVDIALLEESAGRLDHLELVLEVFDAPTGRLQRISFEALDPGALPGVDQRLTPPAIEGLHCDSELFDEVLDGFAGEHPLTGLSTDLGGIVPWHVWLLVDQGQIVTRVVHFLGSRSQNKCRSAVRKWATPSPCPEGLSARCPYPA